MPLLHTAHFGPLEYTPASTLQFSEGLPGFESEHSFLLVERPAHHPLVFLQSVDTPELCFPALPVRVIEAAYEPQLDTGDLEILGFSGQPGIGEDAVVLVLIAMHEQNPTANLLAPIVINLTTRAAAQCIDPGMRYSHRHLLLPVLEAAS
jgi:flagellar assembly factor FliW